MGEWNSKEKIPKICLTRNVKRSYRGRINEVQARLVRIASGHRPNTARSRVPPDERRSPVNEQCAWQKIVSAVTSHFVTEMRTSGTVCLSLTFFVGPARMYVLRGSGRDLDSGENKVGVG